jgi:hypothetical protein
MRYQKKHIQTTKWDHSAIWWDQVDVHPVDRILRQCNNKYLVKWLSPDMKDTWLDKKEITPDLITEFETGICKQEEIDFNLANARYLEKHPGQKNQTNCIFITAIECYVGSEAGSIIYLEGQNLRTTNMLLDRNFIQPLFPINFDPNIIAMIRSHQLPNVIPYVRSLYDMILFNDRPIAALWADYCSTLEGSSYCSPKKDIALLFQKQHLINNSVLACTFSLRSNPKIHETHKRKIKNIEKFIQKEARKNKYCLDLFGKMTYGRSMFFIIYICSNNLKTKN